MARCHLGGDAGQEPDLATRIGDPRYNDRIVPKGIPEKPGEKHLAVHVEDHPLEYADFEGTIPEGEYGAGQVKIWARGLYEPLYWKKDKIEVVMKGEHLAGRYVLVRFRRAGKDEWLLFRAKD